MSVDISARLNRNRIMSGVADQFCRIGNKQAVGCRFALQSAVQKHALRLHRAENVPFNPDHQFFAVDVAFDIAVDMKNAVAVDVAANLGGFADNRRHLPAVVAAAESARQFEIHHFFELFHLIFLINLHNF